MERRKFLTMLPAIGATPAVLDAASLINVPDSPTDADVERIRAAKDELTIKTPFIPNLIDRRDHALYDVLRVAAGVAVPKLYYFFANPIGQPRFDKHGRLSNGVCLDCGAPVSGPTDPWNYTTKRDTNMVSMNQLPPPQSLLLERILFVLGPDTDPGDAERLSTGYYYEFRLADKIFSCAPLVRCSASGEPEALIDADGERNLMKIGRELAVHLKSPIYIPPLCRFLLNIYGPEPFVAQKDISLFAFLDGVGDFPVQ